MRLNVYNGLNMQKKKFPIPYLFYLLVIISTSCQEPKLDYETAISSCKPKAHINEKGDTTYYYFSSADCILGAQLPEFTDTTMEGTVIDKEYFQEKVSVINFWFIGCKPCEAEMPGFNKLVEKYSSSPVRFLAIGRNSPGDIDEFLADHPFHFDHIAYGEPIIKNNFKHKWAYPFTIVADRNMKILFTQIGGKADTSAIEHIQQALIPVIDRALKEY